MSDRIGKIVAAYDGSEGAGAGLRLGAEIARITNAKLIVAAAIDFMPVVPSSAPIAAIGYSQFETARQAQFGQIFRRACRIVETMPFERRELAGGAARALIECAEDEDADLITLGATHHGPLGRVFPGSVGQKVLQGSRCPVAVAPRKWSAEPIERVAVGFDDGAESHAALRFAAAIAAPSRARLDVISVLPEYMVVDGQLLDDVDMRELCRDRMDRAVAALPGRGASGVLLEHGEGVAETLVSDAGKRDLIVVGSRGYGAVGRILMGSVSARLMASPPCAAIAVPRPAHPPERGRAERESVAAA